ncbi:hypothetical protein ALI144C_15085 [Actinosynnema sp. ALI-1.44]|uniref:hypothetical protein n=1 Tax=Actinosynnema sp. ALI-1.44 TaxID=1933779 RepID=UPI00097C935D|nr:hypothetical protein [Actinosynnema sp. ALI-1.44]ONI84471.1 hypothetical protein ALI144C_15085 [Actinosynnema sp. ALI-1.44]
MTLVVLDVVVVLTPDLRRDALVLGDLLIRRMRENGCAAHFRLGRPYGATGPCEPHVSIFMLTVDDQETADVVSAIRSVAVGIPVLRAEGDEYRHNPFGAPELYFRKTAKWIDLQRAVIAAAEPLRRGRLRVTDPAGTRIRDLIDDPSTEPERRDQLVRFGYDEVTENGDAAGGPGDRFNPHVTLAWPVDPEFRVDLGDLPPAGGFSGTLTELAVYGMSPYGTCTTLYGKAPLGAMATTAVTDEA